MFRDIIVDARTYRMNVHDRITPRREIGGFELEISNVTNWYKRCIVEVVAVVAVLTTHERVRRKEW